MTENQNNAERVEQIINIYNEIGLSCHYIAKRINNKNDKISQEYAYDTACSIINNKIYNNIEIYDEIFNEVHEIYIDYKKSKEEHGALIWVDDAVSSVARCGESWVIEITRESTSSKKYYNVSCINKDSGYSSPFPPSSGSLDKAKIMSYLHIYDVIKSRNS